jgi:Helix-hairpin-helix motif
MVRGLADKDGAALVGARGETPFSSVDDLWRRAKVPVSSLVELADADAMKGDARPGAPAGASGQMRSVQIFCSVRQRIGPKLDVHGTRHRALAAFL